MVNDVKFMISYEDLASRSRTRLDQSELLWGRSLITVKQDREISDMDIRRRRVPHLLVLSRHYILLPDPLPQPIKLTRLELTIERSQ